jgi:hypothetical protein
MAIMHERRQTVQSDGTGKSGDAMAYTTDGSGNLQVTTADSTNDTEIDGVLADSKDNIEGFAAGETVSLHTGGIVVMNVTDGVAAADRIGASATEGVGTSGGDDGTALSAAGGEFLGPIPDGYAAVDLGGVQ